VHRYVAATRRLWFDDLTVGLAAVSGEAACSLQIRIRQGATRPSNARDARAQRAARVWRPRRARGFARKNASLAAATCAQRGPARRQYGQSYLVAQTAIGTAIAQPRSIRASRFGAGTAAKRSGAGS
jgi:hypothetical protein